MGCWWKTGEQAEIIFCPVQSEVTALAEMKTYRWLLASMIGIVSSEGQTRVSSAPNIILILADDLGWNEVSWNNPFFLTPNLEVRAGPAENYSELDRRSILVKEFSSLSPTPLPSVPPAEQP